MKTRPRRRDIGNVTPSALVRFDMAKQKLFVAIAGKRKVNSIELARVVDLSEGHIEKQLKRLGWKRSTGDVCGAWFLP